MFVIVRCCLFTWFLPVVLVALLIRFFLSLYLHLAALTITLAGLHDC